MTKTEKHGFGGGNTDWEESRLGSFAKRSYDLYLIICINNLYSILKKYVKEIWNA